jgi:hypothetical protein
LVRKSPGRRKSGGGSLAVRDEQLRTAEGLEAAHAVALVVEAALRPEVAVAGASVDAEAAFDLSADAR